MQPRFRWRVRRFPPVLAVLVIVGMLFGYVTIGAVAADPPEAINGCFDNNSRIVRVSDTCRTTEMPLSWPSIEMYQQDLALLQAQDASLAQDIADLTSRVEQLEDADYQTQINDILDTIAELQSEDEYLLSQIMESEAISTMTQDWLQDMAVIVRLILQAEFDEASAKLTTLLNDIFPGAGNVVNSGLQATIQHLDDIVAEFEAGFERYKQKVEILWCVIFPSTCAP
jgi:hypothetical protein